MQLIARIGHFGDQATNPSIELQFKKTSVFGRTNIFALNQFQIVRNTRQQEDIGQTCINAAVGRCIRGVIQGRLLSRVSAEEAGIISIFIKT
ncbi:hypothetical protein D3C80_1836060 [compost metagenome]